MAEQRRDLPGVGFEPVRRGPGLVEDAADVADLGVVDPEDALERLDLVAGHPAVDLGELGAEHDHRGGKRDPAGLGRIAEHLAEPGIVTGRSDLGLVRRAAALSSSR